MSRINQIKRVFSRCLVCSSGLLMSDAGLAAQAGWPEPVGDNQVFSLVIADQLEYRANQGADTLRWDVQGWLGTDSNKLWVKTEGEDARRGSDGGEGELQLLYSRMIAPFWDVQAGLRYESIYGDGPDRDRNSAVVGVQGLAPYRFEVDSALFASENGDLSARFTASYELLLTQRLILQPRFETNLAAQQVEKFGIGRGINDIELGLRLRYEVKREFAPYIGVSWQRKLGDSGDFARDEGTQVDDLSLVAGLRVWF